jgi:hypothetical protein
MHFRFDAEQQLEGVLRLFENCSARVGESVLRQVTDCERGRLEDTARIGLIEPRHHPQQRRFAGAVWTAEADSLLVRDLPRDVVEEDAIAERFGER